MVLTITSPADSQSAGSYYAREGLEREGGFMGPYRGNAARLLGLSGIPSADDLRSLIKNRNPFDGSRLTQRDRVDKKPLTDFTFSPPKSIAVAHQIGGDMRISREVMAAVDDTQALIQPRAVIRVRRKKRYVDTEVGNTLWVNQYHLLTRPTKGTPDPGDHVHSMLFNVGHLDGKRYSVELGPVKSNGRFYEAYFHTNLAHRMRNLGYDITPTKDAFELKGIPSSVLEAFSQRSKVIEAAAKQRGIKAPKGRAALAAITRERKLMQVQPDKLHKLWKERLTPYEYHLVGSVTRRAMDAMHDTVELPNALHVEKTMEGFLGRVAAVAEETLFERAMRENPGEVTLEGMQEALEGGDYVRAKVDGVPTVTTKAMLAKEKGLMGFAGQERGKLERLGLTDKSVGDSITEEQQVAVRHVMKSRDPITLLRHRKGKERVAIEKATVAGLEAAGHEVETVGAGRMSAWLRDDSASLEPGGVVFVTDAEQLRFDDACELAKLAEEREARLVLAGYLRDYRKPARGEVMGLLEDVGGLKTGQVRPLKFTEKAAKAGKAWMEKAARTVEAVRRLDFLRGIQERSLVHHTREAARGWER